MRWGLGYSKSELKRLAAEKLEDATILMDLGRWGNAYYLSGYSVELGLKVCIASQFRADEIPHPSLVKNIYIHKFGKLAEYAGLDHDLRQSFDTDSHLKSAWATVCEWSEDTRYETKDGADCLAMIPAAREMLKWISRYW